jgi:hypothetical protein
LQHSKPNIISRSTKYLIIKHNTNSHKSKLKIYQFNNVTHKTKRQCNCFTLIFLCLGGDSTGCSGGEAINSQWFATKKKQLKDLLGQRKDDSGVLVEDWRLFWAIGGWFCYEVFGF